MFPIGWSCTGRSHAVAVRSTTTRKSIVQLPVLVSGLARDPSAGHAVFGLANRSSETTWTVGAGVRRIQRAGLAQSKQE